MGHRVSWLPKRLGLDPGRIVDTYVCIAPPERKAPGLPRVGRGVAGDMEQAKLSDLIEDMDRARVTVSLVVLHEETHAFFHMAAQHPGRFFGLAYYDSLSPRRGLERIQGLCNECPDLVLGVTTAMSRFGQDPRLEDFVPLYEFCAEQGLPVQFCARSDQTQEEADRPMALAVLARRYPGLKVICQYNRSRPEEVLALLHRFPNLFLQVDEFPLQTLHCAADSRKLLFGSGWRGREPGYFERVEAVRRLPWWQRHNVSWHTAVRVYGYRIRYPVARSNPQPSSR
jgi:predicted TIM-barrel fold metal-dependent hydrolase